MPTLIGPRSPSDRFLPLACSVLVLVVLAAPSVDARAQCSEPPTAVFARVLPSVVSVDAAKINKEQARERFTKNRGVGVVIDSDHRVLTNAHVVNGSTSTSVTLRSGEKVPARLIGIDSVLDVALLRIGFPKALPALQLGDSATLRVGDEVATISRPLEGRPALTVGIVSGVSRIAPGVPNQRLIQTDATISSKHPSGLLVDRCGVVVGLTTFAAGETRSMSFAIPINAVKERLPDLLETGHVTRAWLGIEGRAIDDKIAAVARLPFTTGYMVELVYDGSPAERAGIRGGNLSVVSQGEEYLLGGDVVTAINGEPVRTQEEYMARMKTLRSGQRATVMLLRAGRVREVIVTVAERPSLPTDLSQ